MTTTTTAGTARRMPPRQPTDRDHTRAATDALVSLWDALEGMSEDSARAWLTGPSAAFLLGLDVPAVLDALTRDRARRAARGGGANA